MSVNNDSLLCLKNTFPFRNVSCEHLSKLLEGARQFNYVCGKHLFYQGQQATHFYLIKSGAVRLYRLSLDGDEKVFQCLHDGDLLAEAAMFMVPCAYPMNARVDKDCQVTAISREKLLALCRVSSDFSLQMLSALSSRLYQNMNRIDQLTLNNAGQRLVVYLLEQQQAQKNNIIELSVSHTILAGQLNIVPETLSRLLQSFRKKSLISGKRGKIELKNVDGLCQLVGLPPVGSMGFSGDSERTHSLAGCCNLQQSEMPQLP